MSRLIDADTFFEMFPELNCEPYINAPTVDINKLILIVAKRSGKREMMLNALRPQGEWIEGENGNIKCNQCGCEIRYSYLIGNKPDFPKFCCDCGARMKGGEEE